jgi:hypothetical protein
MVYVTAYESKAHGRYLPSAANAHQVRHQACGKAAGSASCLMCIGSTCQYLPWAVHESHIPCAVDVCSI